MLFPWYAATMLAIESNDVIRLRLTRMARGGRDARHEAQLMVAEKISAFVEAAVGLCGGATPASVVGRSPCCWTSAAQLASCPGMIVASGIGCGSPTSMPNCRATTGHRFCQTSTSPLVTLKIWSAAAGLSPAQAIARADPSRGDKGGDDLPPKVH